MQIMQDSPLEAPLATPSRQTLGDHVVQRLRQAILTGQLKPGERLVEQEIAAALHVSRGPVRDALQVLETEHLIERQAHKGAFVVWLTLRDAQEIYSFRGAIEHLALENALQHATDADLVELDGIVAMMADGEAQGHTLAEATELDLGFHSALFRVSRHRRAQAAWDLLLPQVRLLILFHLLRRPADLRTLGAAWHRPLVDALRRRDAATAHGLLNRHVDNGLAEVTAAFQGSGQA
jgi:DNA-binding GntR family transcriptional regulator